MNHTLIIAEAGVNHNGDIATAKKLVEVAAAAGADIVKFQTFKAQNMVTTDALMAEYQEKNTQTKTSQFEMLEKLELSYEAHLELIEHCKQLNIVFFSTGFDIESLEMLHDLGQTFFKVPSGEITNYPYLKKMAAFKPTRIIISTGMATMDDIGACIQTFEQAGVTKDKMTVLHCTTDYPAQLKDVNLSAMLSIQKHFGVRVGYSDHTEGLSVPVAAVAMGAEVIEKHFTLDRNMPGPDHKASLEPEELKTMVRYIREVEASYGDGIKKPTPVEMKNRLIARKSIVARTGIAEGEIFSESNLTTKRPGSGISPMEWNQIIGKRAKKIFPT